APRLEKRSVVVIVGGVLEFARRAIFYGQFDAALSLVRVPDRVIKPELHFLLDVSRKVIGRDPAGVNVKRGLTGVRMPVHDLKLDGIPRRAFGRADKTALPG